MLPRFVHSNNHHWHLVITDNLQRLMNHTSSIPIHLSVSSVVLFGHTPKREGGGRTPQCCRMAAHLTGLRQYYSRLMRPKSILP